MASKFPAIDHRPGLTFPTLLFWAAILATLPVFWTVVGPSLGGGAKADHASHWLLVLLHGLLVLLHGLLGAITLISGFVALWMGWTRVAFAWHRHTGCTYVGAGMTMAALSLILSAQDPHGMTLLVASTATLSVAWVVTTGMGWWRGSQRRWRAHQEWMIRSVVLTWTFVFCRIAQRVEDFAWLGPDGEAIGVWIYWVGPALVCEAGLWWWRRPRLAS